MDAAAPIFAPVAEQLANVRRWNDERGWSLLDWELEQVDLTEATHAAPLVVDVVAVELPAKGPLNGVQRTCAELWDLAAGRQPRSWCWDERRRAPKAVRLLDGVEHRPGVRRVTLDLAAHWDRRRGTRPIDVRYGASAAAEILAAAAHFPHWVRAMDGEGIPFVCLAGYQVTVPVYETWRHILCLSWSHINRRINLSDNWADYYQDRFASPVRVGAPVRATRPSG
ncbi:MAG: hypothetical protein M3066_09105 [Actinomycetota bacterium]|nr:hypothetical protein [Actinomycetota bacterium]